MARKLQRIFATVLVLLLVLVAVFWFRPVSFFRAWSEIRFAMDGARSHKLSIHGVRVHYYELGPEDGRPVVLVHGLGGRAEDWQNLAPYLAQAGYRVYLPDLPGYGHSAQPANFSYSVADEAAMVADFLDALQLRQVDLGGWSMGGWIAQRIAAAYPERVRKLMLFDSAGLAVLPAWNTALFVPSNAKELNQLNALLMPQPPEVPGFVARDMLRLSKKNGWVIRRALGSMFTGREVTDTLLPQLKMPVLIVWGGEDHITPLAQGETMHRLVPQSQMKVLAGCGHLAPSQCADQAAPPVVQFLGQ